MHGCRPSVLTARFRPQTEKTMCLAATQCRQPTHECGQTSPHEYCPTSTLSLLWRCGGLRARCTFQRPRSSNLAEAGISRSDSTYWLRLHKKMSTRFRRSRARPVIYEAILSPWSRPLLWISFSSRVCKYICNRSSAPPARGVYRSRFLMASTILLAAWFKAALGSLRFSQLARPAVHSLCNIRPNPSCPALDHPHTSAYLHSPFPTKLREDAP